MAIDPTMTTTLRRAYYLEYKRRWDRARVDLEDAIKEGGFTSTWQADTQRGTVGRYVAAAGVVLLNHLPINRPWQSSYLTQAYKRGIANADRDLRAGGIRISITDTDSAIERPRHLGARLAVQNEVRLSAARVQLRFLQSLETLTADAIGDASEEDLVRILNDRVDKMGISGSKRLVNTAVIGIVAKAALNRARDFGLGLVGAFVEQQFTTAGDAHVCPICQGLAEQDNGNGPGVYTLQEADGIIPVHPECRCTWKMHFKGIF